MIDNIIIDEWFPLVGATGYTIYSLLVRMSNEKDGESVSGSFSLICEHLGITRPTLAGYLTLLEQCQLIYRDRPEVIIVQNGREKRKRNGNRSNTYYILDIQAVTKERLAAIRQFYEEAEDDSTLEGFKTLFLRRVDEWRPIQKLWSKGRQRRIKTVVGQQELPFGDGRKPQDDVPGHDVPPLADITLALFEAIDVRTPAIIDELGHHDPMLVLAQIWHTVTESWVNPDKRAGVVINNLRKGIAPPAGFTELAGRWLEMDEEEGESFYAIFYQLPHDFDEWEFSEAAENAAVSLKKTKDFDFSDWEEFWRSS